jgi:hypothetical protein
LIRDTSYRDSFRSSLAKLTGFFSRLLVPELQHRLGYEGWFEFFGEWRQIEQLDLETMQRASPSPAEFTVSHPYAFTFYFVPSERQQELARLARLP